MPTLLTLDLENNVPQENRLKFYAALANQGFLKTANLTTTFEHIDALSDVQVAVKIGVAAGVSGAPKYRYAFLASTSHKIIKS